MANSMFNLFGSISRAVSNSVVEVSRSEVSKALKKANGKNTGDIVRIYGLAPSVLISDLLTEQAQKGGIFIQIFQRFHSVNKNAILDLMEMFSEVLDKYSTPKNKLEYIHTASVMCINDSAEFNGKNVFSVFDGQHRTIFFVLVILSLIKIARKNKNKAVEKELKKMIFKKGIMTAENFILKYADQDNQKTLSLFVEKFRDYLDCNMKSSFTSFVEENNSFSKSLEIIEKEVKNYVKVKTDFDTFVDVLTNRIGVILRFLQPFENEILIFLYENKESIPFAEFEAVKMITTSFFKQEEDKLDYAKKFSETLHWLRDQEGSSLSDNDIAHALRATVMDLEEFDKRHISITSKADRENRLSEVIREIMSSNFHDISEEFLKGFKDYLFLMIALKEGNLNHSDKLTNAEKSTFNQSEDINKIVKLYSHIYLKSGTSGQRFSYLALPKLRQLIFTNEINIPLALNEDSPLRHMSVNEENEVIREEIFNSFLTPAIVYSELLLAEFFVTGNNIFKPFELNFDQAFVKFVKGKDDSFKILKDTILSSCNVTKESLRSNLISKKNWNEIHTDRKIQTLILMLIERYSFKNCSAESAIQALNLLFSNVSLEHVIPEENDLLFKKDSDKETVSKHSNYWFLTALLEKELNSKASNHLLETKTNAYEKSKFSNIQRFKSQTDYLSIVEKSNLEDLQVDVVDLIMNKISIFN